MRLVAVAGRNRVGVVTFEILEEFGGAQIRAFKEVESIKGEMFLLENRDHLCSYRSLLRPGYQPGVGRQQRPDSVH